MTPCPCCSGKTFAACCAPLLQGEPAAAPEHLMRSRYTAFYLHNADYLQRSLHPSRHKPDELTQLQATFKTHWLGLEIIAAADNWVEFIAFYEENGQLQQLHEKSQFYFEAPHWYYQDGIHLTPRKISRNEPCPCRSGKKYKKCHDH